LYIYYFFLSKFLNSSILKITTYLIRYIIYLNLFTDSYEEAKRKANIAQESSDLSEVEQKETYKLRAKVVESSPSPSPKKFKSKLKERSLLTP